MCEVEFWEVFLERCEAFFCVVAHRFHVLTAE